MPDQAEDTDQADDILLFKKLIQKPRIAWPTVALLAVAVTIFVLSTTTYVADALPLGWAILINSIASYMSFTVAHDAAHNSIFANKRMNDWAGRFSIILLEPGPFFQVFRFVHMKHHRFTNDREKDPDAYCGMGPRLSLPFRWLTLDFIYFKTYLSSDVFRKRPENERREFYFSLLFAASIITAVTLAGWLHYYLLLFLIPTRIAKTIIVIAFDFLPHYPHEVRAKEAPFQCTSNRVGMEWLLTPIFVYQNYHLVHHLYPSVPFYRYLRIWNARKHYHDSHNPATTNTFSLKPR